MILQQAIEMYRNIKCDNMRDYVEALVKEKAKNDALSWQNIADMVANIYGEYHSRKWYTVRYSDWLNALSSCDDDEKYETSSDTNKSLLEIQKERVKLSDERIQMNAYIRQIAREERAKEIAIEAAKAAASIRPFKIVENEEYSDYCDREAILLISDWHYGMEVDSPFNKYNTTIAKERVEALAKKVHEQCELNGIERIHILNLGDMIAGRIHLPIRLESRIDTITQIIEVSELIANFIDSLSDKYHIDYYSCTDNHSRLEPNKSEALDAESLCRITDWYLTKRLNGSDVRMHKNEFGNDIITFKVFDFDVAGVHGDKDPKNLAIEKLTLMTRRSYDMVCTAHLHHFSADEHTGTLLVSNPSLMAADNYALKLRLHSQPAQTLIIASRDNIMENLIRIVLPV